MVKKLAKKVAALHMKRCRSKTASAKKPSLPEGSPPQQVLPEANSIVASWFCRDWPERGGAWQDMYSSEVDQYHHTPTRPLRLRLRTSRGEEYHLTALVGVDLETGRFRVISRAGDTDVKGFPKEGHTLDTILAWVGEDEYSERAVYLPNSIDPNAERWKVAMNLNVKSRVLKLVSGLAL